MYKVGIGYDVHQLKSGESLILGGVDIEFDKGISEENYEENYSIISKYDHNKINNLFRNFDTMSFLDLILNYQDLQNKGYNKAYLDQNLNSMKRNTIKIVFVFYCLPCYYI